MLVDQILSQAYIVHNYPTQNDTHRVCCFTGDREATSRLGGHISSSMFLGRGGGAQDTFHTNSL